jgi:enoyl-CoA hydratase/carnithine racemase
LKFFVDEYRLDYAIHTFSKPIVALLDGVTMGSGMGLGQGANLRVVTEKTKMSMPEARIGLFPDVGATRFLSVMPTSLELYVGLTGATLSGADALLCNLADMCVPCRWLETFEERLQRMPLYAGKEKLTLALRTVFEPRGNIVPHSPLDSLLSRIAAHFDDRLTVEAMLASLQQALDQSPSGEVRQWLQSTTDALRYHSPMMLKVTHEALLRGRHLSLSECLRMELGMMKRAIEDGDFLKGVRAHLIDKDRSPCWRPPTLAEVRPLQVRHFTLSPWRSDAHPLADLGPR